MYDPPSLIIKRVENTDDSLPIDTEIETSPVRMRTQSPRNFGTNLTSAKKIPSAERLEVESQKEELTQQQSRQEIL